MGSVPVTAAIEVVKLLLSTILEFARTNNVSKEELEKVWSTTLAEFNANDPNDLPDV